MAVHKRGVDKPVDTECVRWDSENHILKRRRIVLARTVAHLRFPDQCFRYLALWVWVAEPGPRVR
jgi:hypothetical protein